MAKLVPKEQAMISSKKERKKRHSTKLTIETGGKEEEIIQNLFFFDKQQTFIEIKQNLYNPTRGIQDPTERDTEPYIEGR